MEHKALIKSIKTLKKMVSFYKENPCDLDMGNYANCAMGTWLKSKGTYISHHCANDKISKYFKIEGIYDISDQSLSKLSDDHRLIERDVIQLFCTFNKEIWAGDTTSKIWVKEAKKVIKSLEYELENV